MNKITGKIVPIMRDNIDTDILIPKNFLKTTKRTGFEDALFYPWRYDEKGNLRDDFPLNQEKYKGANILVVGENFGCGSSREHAAWALKDFGIQAVIAGGFSPIFYMNFINNNCVPIVLSKNERDEIRQFDEAIIDVQNMKVCAGAKTYSFSLEETFHYRLVHDLDTIGETLLYEDKITEYERKHQI